ncbi:hypothetical protein MD588_14060 [Photobacterium sp. SDRW27]|uniref:hypothetical protein n=1 Tax=Photobacterium obscurum TaxID=2829490 RepID=UPI002244401A|nr:hypothetical protein [Photobacterium obscurum]MCW8329929.1 hypothetical protein [Photobacterium obscurum]
MGLSGGKNDEPQKIIDYCQLSTKACEQNHAIVTLSNDVIHPMQSAEVSVSWPDIPQNTDSLILSLEGHEMMMGVYKLKLTRTLNGHFSGNLMLPFCTSEEMTWQGSIKPDSNSVKIEPINVSLRMIK